MGDAATDPLEVEQHRRRLQHATSAWDSVMRELPEAGHQPARAQQQRQWCDHATKLLSLPLLCLQQLPRDLSDATVELVVRIHADSAAQHTRLQELGDDRQQLMQEVSKWCAWGLQLLTAPQLEEAAAQQPRQKRRRTSGGGTSSSDGDSEGATAAAAGDLQSTFNGATALLAHFGVGALDWAGALAAEGARSLTQHLPRCDNAALTAIAMEALPAVHHPAALPAIEELVAHCCRTALIQACKKPAAEHAAAADEEAGELDTALPLAFRVALLQELDLRAPRPFDSFRSSTKQQWWRLQPADFGAEILQLACGGCASYRHGDAYAGADADADAEIAADTNPDAVKEAVLQHRVQAVAECSVGWYPLLQRAVDILLRLLRDTGHPAIQTLLDSLIAAYVAAPLTHSSATDQSRLRLLQPMHCGAGTMTVTLAKAKNDRDSCKTWLQLAQQPQPAPSSADDLSCMIRRATAALPAAEADGR